MSDEPPRLWFLELFSGSGHVSHLAQIIFGTLSGASPSTGIQEHVLKVRPQDIVLLWASPPCEQFSRVQQCRGTLNPIAGDRCVYTVMDFIKIFQPLRWWIATGHLGQRPYFFAWLRIFREALQQLEKQETSVWINRKLRGFKPKKCAGMPEGCPAMICTPGGRSVKHIDNIIGKPAALNSQVPGPLIRELLKHIVAQVPRPLICELLKPAVSEVWAALGIDGPAGAGCAAAASAEEEEENPAAASAGDQPADAPQRQQGARRLPRPSHTLPGLLQLTPKDPLQRTRGGGGGGAKAAGGITAMLAGLQQKKAFSEVCPIMDDALEAQRALVWDYHTRMAEVVRPGSVIAIRRDADDQEFPQYCYYMGRVVQPLQALQADMIDGWGVPVKKYALVLQVAYLWLQGGSAPDHLQWMIKQSQRKALVNYGSVIMYDLKLKRCGSGQDTWLQQEPEQHKAIVEVARLTYVAGAASAPSGANAAGAANGKDRGGDSSSDDTWDAQLAGRKRSRPKRSTFSGGAGAAAAPGAEANSGGHNGSKKKQRKHSEAEGGSAAHGSKTKKGHTRSKSEGGSSSAQGGKEKRQKRSG